MTYIGTYKILIEMIPTLSDFTDTAPAPEQQEHTVKIGDTCNNWRTVLSRLPEVIEKYGHAIIWSNGAPDKAATQWEIRRSVS